MRIFCGIQMNGSVLSNESVHRLANTNQLNGASFYVGYVTRLASAIDIVAPKSWTARE